MKRKSIYQRSVDATARQYGKYDDSGTAFSFRAGWYQGYLAARRDARRKAKKGKR